MSQGARSRRPLRLVWAAVLLVVVLLGVFGEWFSVSLGCSEGVGSSLACFSHAPGYTFAHTLFEVLLGLGLLALLLLFALRGASPRARSRAAVTMVIAALALVAAAADYLGRSPSHSWCVRQGLEVGGSCTGPAN